MPDQKKKKPYSTPQLVLASFAFGSCMVLWTIYNSYVPLILDQKLSSLGSAMLSTTAVSTLTGLIMTIDNLFGLVFQPIFGRRSDSTRSRFGKRMPYVIVGILSCAVLFALIPIMARIPDLAGVLAMMAVIICFNFIMSTWRAPCVAIMPDMVPAEYQSDGNAVVNMMSAVFTILASGSAGILGLFGLRQAIDGGDYRSVFLFGSLVSVFCLVVLLTCVRWQDNRGEAAAAAVQKQEKKESLRELGLSRPALTSMLFMMVALFCISGTSDGVGTYFTLYATKLLGLSATTATLIKTVGTAGAVLLAVPAGIAGRRLGRRRTILAGLIVVSAMHIFMFGLPYFAGDFVAPLLSVCYFLYAGAFIMININTLPIMLSIGGKERYGAFTGYYYLATFTAAVVCPVVLGYIAGAAGYNMMHMFALFLMAVAVFCILRVHHGDAMSAEEEAALDEAVRQAEQD